MIDLLVSEIRSEDLKDCEIVVEVHMPSAKTAETYAVAFKILKEGAAVAGWTPSHLPQSSLEKAFEHGFSLGRDRIKTYLSQDFRRNDFVSRILA